MTEVIKTQAAVEQLSVAEMRAFGDWFADLQARLWDAQIERDLAAGKLDKRADKWRADYQDGKFTDL